MKLNNTLRLMAIVGLISSTAVMYGWHIKVYNATPFAIHVKCDKIGLIKTEWEDIKPLETKEVKCGGGDCIKGMHVKIETGDATLGTVTLWSGNLDAKNKCRNMAAIVGCSPVLEREALAVGLGYRYFVKQLKFFVTGPDAHLKEASYNLNFKK